MPYRYVLKWQKGEHELLVVEAWPKTPELALPNERHRPSFVIGRVTGSRTLMLAPLVDQLRERYRASERNHTVQIEFPTSDSNAIAEAYRAGLAAAVIEGAVHEAAAETAYRYLLHASHEEIWFWTSKYLGVVGDNHPPDRVIRALSALTGADLSQAKPATPARPRGRLWKLVAPITSGTRVGSFRYSRTTARLFEELQGGAKSLEQLTDSTGYREATVRFQLMYLARLGAVERITSSP